MDSSFFNTQNSHGIMVEEEEEEDVDSVYSSSSSEVSSLSDFTEDANSNSASSSLISSPCSSSSPVENQSGPLYEMSSLIQQLPFKRGLSKHYQGKSQSFTSLSNVSSLEDLAKPENPYQKKLKSCKSYIGLSEKQEASRPKTCSKSTLSKKASRSSCSSLNAKRNSSFGGNRPPIPQHKTSTLSHQTPLFA